MRPRNETMAPAPEVTRIIHPMSYPRLHWLTQPDDKIDYRPAIGPDGNKVVFESTPLSGGSPTVLLLLDGINSKPTAFLSGSGVPASQTRPDWCWNTDHDKIAFNGRPDNKSPLLVCWVEAKDRKKLYEVSGTSFMAYPTWSRDGQSLVSENGSGIDNNPSPCNTWFALPKNGGSISIKAPNIDGNDSKGVSLFGGMPTVGPNDLPQIAFAGQPVIQGWGPHLPPPFEPGPPPPGPIAPIYNEDYNYIFRNSYDETNKIYTSAPMESAAPLKYYGANYQGRAPAWSKEASSEKYWLSRRR